MNNYFVRNVLFEFIIIFLIFFFIFVFYFFLIKKRNIQDEDFYGIYEIKTNLPSFLGNSLSIKVCYGEKEYKIFLGRVWANMKLEKENFYLQAKIFLNYISNFDILFLNKDLFKYLRNTRDTIDIEIQNSNCFIYFKNQKVMPKCYFRIKKNFFSNTKFVDVNAILYEDLESKGIFNLTKKIYIEQINLNINLVKK
ncbi:MAG: hypothetical protein ACK42K_06130 [Leptonema sp. (in: bacteria)]